MKILLYWSNIELLCSVVQKWFHGVLNGNELKPYHKNIYFTSLLVLSKRNIWKRYQNMNHQRPGHRSLLKKKFWSAIPCELDGLAIPTCLPLWFVSNFSCPKSHKKNLVQNIKKLIKTTPLYVTMPISNIPLLLMRDLWIHVNFILLLWLIMSNSTEIIIYILYGDTTSYIKF